MAVVKLLVSELLLRSELLRLGGERRIVGAHLTEPLGYTIEFDIDDPDAPEDALAIEPVYTRNGLAPDPVRLAAIRWQHADGTWTRQDIPAAE